MPTQRQAIDVHVGRRLREQRLTKGLSQSELAGRLGVTYQQIQKYESGANRISAGRLQGLADALAVPVAWFFEDAAPALQPAGGPEGGALAGDAVSEADLARLDGAFLAIRSAPLRRGVLRLVELIADEAPGSRDPSVGPARPDGRRKA